MSKACPECGWEPWEEDEEYDDWPEKSRVSGPVNPELLAVYAPAIKRLLEDNTALDLFIRKK